MISTGSEWNARNAAMAKRPIYVFAIGGQSTVYATHDLAAEGVTGTLPAYAAWLKVPQGATQTVQVTQGQSSIGELSCEVVDIGGAVRTLVGTETLEGAAATLSVGYPGIPYTEFAVLHTYQIYKVTPGRNYGSFVFRSRDVQMAAKRTVRTHPENGAAISEENPWVIQGTPAEMVQAVYLWALGRPLEWIDRARMVALDSGAEGLVGRPFRFSMTEAFEAKQFIETEILKASGMYPVVTAEGQYSLRSARPPAAGAAAVFAFTRHNMTVLPEVDRQPVVNEIVWKIDHDGSEARTELVFADATSISAYGRSGQMSIESKGLRTELGAWWWCGEVSSRLFRRFAGVAELKGGALVVKVEAFLATLPVWVGDYVSVTHPAMPDLTSGALGVSGRVFEVIDRNPDYAAGKMRYTLLDTGLTELAAAHKYASSGRNAVIGTTEVY